jgi:hypothetical protein
VHVDTAKVGITMSYPNVHMHEYVTRTRHEGQISVYPAGTPCLAARMPDGKVVLTFEKEAIILGAGWYIEGHENPERMP